MAAAIAVAFLATALIVIGGCRCQRTPYIVLIDTTMKPTEFLPLAHAHWYSAILKEVSDHGSPEELILYSYEHTLHGFSAKLTAQEARRVESLDPCLGIVEDSLSFTHTTRSPQFLGLDYHSPQLAEFAGDGKDIVVGVLDTGIWPESQSFSDEEIVPKTLPPQWKGECEAGTAFNSSHCNMKLIGARFFLKGYESLVGHVTDDEDFRSPRDASGHGTHTASTAAGAKVKGANLLGYANGTARGMAPAARLAAYKVCWKLGCVNSDVLAAIDAAVVDGVHVISLSIGSRSSGNPQPYYKDPISIASFGAMQRGVFVSCSAGNDGPKPSLISNTAPWLTTVGASTIDRDFPAPVLIGNGKEYPGSSLYAGPLQISVRRMAPLFHDSVNTSARFCLPGGLHLNHARGKIIFCERGINSRVEKGLTVRAAGGVGMILGNEAANGEDLTADSHILPATIVGAQAAKAIKRYINTSAQPEARISFSFSTVVGRTRAPVVAAFSSRGPNPLTSELLKPDIVAPGVNILAAWTGHSAPTELKADKRRVKFNIMSGTSMACPHVSGIAALLRAAHPDWSPAAMRSALMTTALLSDNTGTPSITDASSANNLSASPFAVGAGNVNPSAAMFPGLVYDLGTEDYTAFLCSLNYTPKQIYVFTHDWKSASICKGKGSPLDLNYPSFSVVFSQKRSVRVARRVLKSAADAGFEGSWPWVFKVGFRSPKDVDIKVTPSTLTFAGAADTASFTVTFTDTANTSNTGIAKMAGIERFGLIWWERIDGPPRVLRSPVVVTWQARSV